MSKPHPPPLLNTRAALVLLLGLLSGAVGGSLTYLAGDNIAAAVFVGVTEAGGATTFFHRIIE